MKRIRLFATILVFLLANRYAGFAQDDRGTNCTDCYNQYISTQGQYSSHLGLECNAFGDYSLSGGWLSETGPTGRASFAFGYEAKAMSDISFALGIGAEAIGDKSFAFGVRAISVGASAKTFGTWVTGEAPGTITMGKGHSEEMPLINYKQNSFALGFNSNVATFFVGPAPGPMSGTTGKVGIGTMDPTEKLHIRADEGEHATLLLEPFSWGENSAAHIILGNTGHGITASEDKGLIFNSEGNYLFRDAGFVGIGTLDPIANLDVNGSFRVADFATVPGEHKIIFADEQGFLFTDNIPLYDNLGNHTAEQDILTNGNWIKHDDISEGQGIFVSPENRIGIGTSMPAAMLDVRSEGETGIIALSTQNENAGFWAANSVFAYGFGVDGDGIGHITANIDNPVPIINFYSNGKVAIGNTLPPGGTSHRLFVEGGITSEEVVINVLNQDREWPDYVFKEGYELMPLNELKEFVSTNGHLPNVPTAKEVKENGQNLGELNAILLEKVEELTLYIMKQQEEIDNLKKLISE
ncbi:MAG: hypothetical protein L3J66_08035 [Bacteroidales bacterium]|nr:hypothetical protein [Bacteroidales bacterium]